jgi:hypothetical protein
MRTKILAACGLLILAACQTNSVLSNAVGAISSRPATIREDIVKPLAANSPPQIKQLLDSANGQIGVTKSYDPAYTILSYPNGDVPMEKGVCTDVIIRAMRKAGVDLQKEVHEDMKPNFSVYPKKWGLKKADPNIDHRRVPNLQTFFQRKGKSLAVTDKPEDYQPGDIVTYDLDGKGMTHIALVSNIYSETSKRYLIIHNIGRGAESENVLFDWKVTGHYRYF